MKNGTKIAIGVGGTILGALGATAYIYFKNNPNALDKIIDCLEDMSDENYTRTSDPVSFSYVELSENE